MVRISQVWDSTVDAVRGRAGLILPVAALALWGPAVVQAAFSSYLSPEAGRAAGAGASLVTLLLTVVSVWGGLVVLAITSAPDVGRDAAMRMASARVLPLVGVALVVGVVIVAALVPLFVALAAGGLDMNAMAAGRFAMSGQLSGGAGLFATLYSILLLAALFWVSARLMPLSAVVLHERRGLGAIGRAFSLTRGLAPKLFGVSLLFGVVLVIASGAVQLVVGTVVRLALGPDGVPTATFLGAVAGAVVSTALTVLAYGFMARLYAALTGDLRDR